MESRNFDPKYSAELLKHLDNQNEVFMETYRAMLHSLQKLQVEEEMLMRKLYEVMSAHGLIENNEGFSNAYYNMGAELFNEDEEFNGANEEH